MPTFASRLETGDYSLEQGSPLPAALRLRLRPPPLLAAEEGARPLFFVLGVVERTPQGSSGRTRYPTAAAQRAAESRRRAAPDGRRAAPGARAHGRRPRAGAGKEAAAPGVAAEEKS